RVRLEVPHVAQDHMTCAPASLAMLCEFWGQKVSHAAIVEEICYDGTYDASVRQWCIDQGWIAKEFRLDWDTLRKVIDRGVPCAVSTKEILTGHLQVLSGYDEFIEAVIIQDPSRTHYLEHLQKSFFENQRLYGPRALAILPKDKQNLLEDIDLPDAALFDELFKLNVSLDKHDRASAQAAMERAIEIDPENRLTYHARNTLASHDRATSAQLEAIDSLLELHPEDERLAWRKLSLLRSSGRYNRALKLLEEYANKRNVSTCWMSELGNDLMEDARQWKRSRKLLEDALARSPNDSVSLGNCATLERNDGSPAESIRLLRFAATNAYRNESYNRQYADSLANERQLDTASHYLHQRADRIGDKSPNPRITLCRFLDAHGQHSASIEQLEEIISKFPDDPDALIFAAKELSSNGHTERSLKILKQAEGKSARGIWLRAAADLCEHDQRVEEALNHWLELSDREPLAYDTITNTTRMLAQMRSEEESLSWLRERLNLYPDSYDIKSELIQRVKGPNVEEAIKLLDGMLEDYPTDPWVIRELSSCHLKARNLEQALANAEKACELSPRVPASWLFKGNALRELERLDEAREAFLKSTECDPDNSNGIYDAINVSLTRERKTEALDRFLQIAQDHSKNGQAFSTYAQLAKTYHTREQALAKLEEVKPEFSHSWRIHAKIIELLEELSRSDEALEMAKEVCEKFPLYPASFADCAELLEKQGQLDEAIDYWQKAFQGNRGWSRTAHGLSTALDLANRSQEALKVLEDALKASPNEYTHHGYIADIHSKRGDMDAAIEQFKKAVILEPGYDWAWGRLSYFLNNSGRHKEMVETARKIAEQRPGEARSWLILGDELTEGYEAFEAIECYDKALQLNPELETAIDRKCQILASTQRVDEAIALCEEEKWQSKPTATLKGRRAWLLHHKGELEKAIEAMSEVTQNYPNYAWGWERIIDWLIEDEKLKEAEEKAESYIAQFPTSADAYFIAAWVSHNRSKHKQCAERCQAALKIDPSHSSAAYNLLRAAIHLTDPQMLADIAPNIRAGLGNFIADCFELSEAILRKDKKKSEETIARLLNHSNATTGWLDMAFLANEHSKANEKWLYARIQKSLAGRPNAPQLANFRITALTNAIDAEPGEFLDHVDLKKGVLIGIGSLVAVATGFGAIALGACIGIFYGRVSLKRAVIPLLKELRQQPDSLEEAIHEMMDLTGNHPFLKSACRDAITLFSPLIAISSRLMGKAGYACATSRDWNSMLLLYQNAERNSEWESWMAFNYVNAHIYAGRLKAAKEIASWALDTLVPDHASEGIQVQLMWLYALNGEIEAAQSVKESLSDKLPEFSGVATANLGAKALLDFHEGKKTASRALDSFLDDIDKSTLKNQNVEMAMQIEMMKRFSKEKISLFLRTVCFFGTQLLNPKLKYKRKKALAISHS
ncbi:MAG: tetratricopeptide repeat protein, partial [Verrucomicrobiota bacterium]